MGKLDGMRPLRTEGQRLLSPKGEERLAKHQSDPHTAKAASAEGTHAVKQPEEESLDEIKVVQFSILFDGDQEKFEYLWALRDTMHRALNAAISEWHRADKVPSKRNANKLTAERGPVTEAVKTIYAHERDYWGKLLPKKQAEVAKLQVHLGNAKAHTSQDEDPHVVKLAKDLENAQRDCLRARVRSELCPPSAIADGIVRFTQSRHKVYLKAAWLGGRSLDTFRQGQPIRWRDQSWRIEADKNAKGSYRLTLPVHSEGRNKIRTESFRIVPDGPSMFGYARRMAEGTVELCDARVVYAERKKQWFAKLTIRVPHTSRDVAGNKVACLRRGVSNAFVLVFEDGSGGARQAEFIRGDDVLHVKRQIKSRKMRVQAHLDRLELGEGARGRGKARRFKAIRRINDAENRFVDWRCKTWGRQIAAMCVERGVGKLYVAAMNLQDMRIDANNYVEALLRNWPFAKMLDQIRAACAAVPVDKNGRVLHGKSRLTPVKHVSVVVEEFDSAYDAVTCPDCGHRHAQKQDERFTCEACGFERPADAIVAWNGLRRAVGKEPLERSKKAHMEFDKSLQPLKEMA